MERLKSMSLKKSFFTIITLFLLAAVTLSTVSFICCMKLNHNIASSIQFTVDDDGMSSADFTVQTDEIEVDWRIQFLNILQIALPILFVITALLLADMVFYRMKLKKPFAILQSGVERIQRQDLDFTVEKYADDELGALCAAFETMRSELLKNNREMWRQMEERKRLNAAFSHDLRNPVTVLKGSAKILQTGLEKGLLTAENAGDTISLITQYSGRIETYIEAMTSAQKLEELQCTPQFIDWSVLANELNASLSILSASAGKEIQFTHSGDNRQICVDKYIIENTAENIVGNALRYARDKVAIDLTCNDGKVVLVVADDGSGFSPTILNREVAPFLRDNNTAEQETHFGMGLYICRLLCEKHGGTLMLENTPDGAKVTATFYF